MSRLPVRLRHDMIQIGRHFSVDFQRTLRIPDDGRDYPLPPGLGRFPLRRVEEYADRVPRDWRETGGFFLPMYQREALWLSFSGDDWHPVAVQVGTGAVSAIDGEAFDAPLARRRQNYVVVPTQPWLDGINAGDGFIRQFVAMPLGAGVSVEQQLIGEETGGIRIAVIEPRAGRFPDESPRRELDDDALTSRIICESAAEPMGLAAGGRMRQSIYPDRNPRDTWDESTRTVVHVHLADSRTWYRVTGEAPPPSPVSAHSYIDAGLPWFALYDEHLGDVRAPARLRGVKSIEEFEDESASTRASVE